jgi:hypothetical protein
LLWSQPVPDDVHGGKQEATSHTYQGAGGKGAWCVVKAFVGTAVVVALAAVGWTLGAELGVSDPRMGQQIGAFTGIVFGLLIFFAIRAQG